MQGMLRLMPDAMNRLFQPTIDSIKNAIGQILNSPAIEGKKTLFVSQFIGSNCCRDKLIPPNFINERRKDLSLFGCASLFSDVIIGYIKMI